MGTCVCPEEGGETPSLGLRVEPMGSEPSASLEGLGSSRRPSRKGNRDSWEPHRVPWFHFVRAGSLHPSLRWSWGGSGGPRISGTASWESADRVLPAEARSGPDSRESANARLALCTQMWQKKPQMMLGQGGSAPGLREPFWGFKKGGRGLP